MDMSDTHLNVIDELHGNDKMVIDSIEDNIENEEENEEEECDDSDYEKELTPERQDYLSDEVHEVVTKSALKVGSKSVECNGCGKKFKYLFCLKRHERVHMNGLSLYLLFCLFFRKLSPHLVLCKNPLSSTFYTQHFIQRTPMRNALTNAKCVEKDSLSRIISYNMRKYISVRHSS